MHMIALKLHRKTGLPWIADFRDPWTNIDFYKELNLTWLADKLHHRREQQVMRVLQADEEYDISDEDIEKQEMAENDMDDDDEMPDDNKITETNPDIEQSGGQL